MRANFWLRQRRADLVHDLARRPHQRAFFDNFEKRLPLRARLERFSKCGWRGATIAIHIVHNRYMNSQGLSSWASIFMRASYRRPKERFERESGSGVRLDNREVARVQILARVLTYNHRTTHYCITVEISWTRHGAVLGRVRAGPLLLHVIISDEAFASPQWR